MKQAGYSEGPSYLCSRLLAFGPDGKLSIFARKPSSDIPPSARVLNPSDTKVTLGIQITTRWRVAGRTLAPPSAGSGRI
jgi:hypothetical protein